MLGDSGSEHVNMSMTRQDYARFCSQVRKSEDVDMCKVILDIRGKTADDLLRMSGQENSCPVDLEKLLKTLSIPCRPLDFEKLNGGSGKILGALVTSGDRAAIFYRQQDARNSHRCRFTVAHELAHACIDPGFSNVHYRMDVEDNNDKQEIAANIFAGELLVPETTLNLIIGKLYWPTVKSLSNIFDVSENVIRKRLQYLKIDYDGDGEII